MSKGNSGYFHGANGKSGGGGSTPPLFNIKQVQVSPDGSSRHGNVPYVKISTSNEGKVKVIDGTRKEYVSGNNEKARMISRRDDDD